MRKLVPLLFFLTLSPKLFSQSGIVAIQVNGIDQKKVGILSIGFFDKDNFPKVGRQSFGINKEITGTTMQIVFEKVPVGVFAVAVFQDIDRNNELKTNLIGFPVEPIGFSNNARIKFGPPSFEDAKITVESGKTVNLIIQLH